MAPIPRAQAIDTAWRALGTGLDPLSAPDGGPLSRTVKLILVPLVLRPIENPGLAGPLVDETANGVLADALAEHAERLRSCAAWYVALKTARRDLGLSLGTPQDLYLQPAFELATREGAPSAHADPGPLARETVIALDAQRSGRDATAVHDRLTDPARRAALAAVLHDTWSTPDDAPLPDHVDDLVHTVLDACPGPVTPPAEAALDGLASVAAGTATGRALRTDGAWPEWLGAGSRARALGLTDHPLPLPPLLDGVPRARRPLDRTVADRVIGVLKHSRDRGLLPPVDELLADEAVRAARPWGLLDESLRVVAVLGTVLAAGIQSHRGGLVPATTRAHEAVNSRWRREASLARARRLTVAPDPDAHPRLVAVAERLAEPWKDYLQRLWVRLHGADTRGTFPRGLAETWDVLDGIARSVVLDHRSRVRAALLAIGQDAG